MIIYTIGFTKKSAEEFFEKISQNNIEVLIDTRLNNQSQLAGFSKGRDLPYFLKKISNCNYSYQKDYAPTKDILDVYKIGKIDWKEYDEKYLMLIRERNVVKHFSNNFSEYSNILLLCSEHTAECCHRRLLAEEISKDLGYRIVHL